jgi:hypothetical protein
MFEQLFKCPHALARHRHGPLVEERCRYTCLSPLRFTGQACRWLAFLRRLQSEAVAYRPYSEIDR